MIKALGIFVATLLLTACGGSSAAPATVAPQPPSATGTPAAAPPAPTATIAEPTAVAATGCVIRSPSQLGATIEDVVASYSPATEAQCAAYLVPQGTWAQTHPPVRIAAEPAGKPVCDVTVKGIRIRVWGGAAARFVCSTLAAQ